MASHIKTLKVRVKDKHAKVLRRMACEVNTVWNYVNELSSKSWQESRVWLSAYDMHEFLSGSSREFDLIGAATIQGVTERFCSSRNKSKRARIRWRISNPKSSRRSLGWVPFKGVSVKQVEGEIRFAGYTFSIWDSYGIKHFKLRSGCFSEDSRGRWYFCVAVSVNDQVPAPCGTAVGIDLGMKDAATLSTGESVKGRECRVEEESLATAQRARKKKRVKAIHAKIKNRRQDRIHKLSTQVSREFSIIVVGDVNSKSMIKKGKGFAKSVLDAGWFTLKTQLGYKASRRRGAFLEVDEKFTTMTCSLCGLRSGPKGLEGLVIREWECSCGAVHDRDVNAAQNILALGLERLAGGILAF